MPYSLHHRATLNTTFGFLPHDALLAWYVPQFGALLERLNVESHKQLHMIAQFSDTDDLGKT